MPKRSPDEVFQLVKTLEKAEKRNFKLFMGRNAASEELKIIQLFDAMDRMEMRRMGSLFPSLFERS